jgi:hypothetical protein
MSKAIRANVYMESRMSRKTCIDEKDADGYLFSEGKYRTRILPSALPEWYIYGFMQKRYGFISAKDVKHLVYVPNYTIDNHLYKYDMLFISYDTAIEPYRTEGGFAWYKGYDHSVEGPLIVEFVNAAEKYSGYDVSGIRQELKKKQVWYRKRNTK